jgi:cell division protease FtsH
MVTVYGMNEKVGKLSFYDPQQENTFTKPYAEETGKLIDDEVRALVDQAYLRTRQLLTDKRDKVEKLALALLDREVLHKDDVEIILGKRPYEEKKIFAEGETEESASDITANGTAGNGIAIDGLQHGQTNTPPVETPAS